MKKLLVFAMLVTMPALSYAETVWQFTAGTGAAFNSSEDITIERDDGSDIELGVVDFKTRPDKAPPYYNLRLSRWEEAKAWEVEFIHHKLYADKSDLSGGVSNLESTGGYNLLYGNYASEIEPNLIVRAGAGLVIPHPDVTIDGNRSHGGYQLGGVTGQLGVERQFPLSGDSYFSVEGKVTYSYAQIKIDEGKAVIPNTAVHLIAALKFDL